MALQVWLPLTKDLRNQGLSNVTVTNNGATFNSAGKLGGCYQFDGTNDNLSYTPNVDGLETLSIAFWACPTAATPSGTFFSIERDTYWQITFYNNNVAIRDNSVGYSGTRKNFSTGTYTANEWTHVVVTYNKGILKIYRDGSLLSTNSIGGTKLNTGINNARIGSAVQSGYYYAGKLNDVRIYDHCLSPMEVKELSKGLVLHYPLSSNSIQQMDNCYSYPRFETSSSGGGWSHWGGTGHKGDYGQSTDTNYIYREGQSYAHWVSDGAGATYNYLLYQSPAFEGGQRSLQCICKEENSLPITESIVYPTWNARSGGTPNNKWTSITSLGNGFYYCKCENIQQDGSNNLIGFYVKPGYKVYFSEAYVENNKECCSDIFYPTDIIYDTSGFCNNSTASGTFTVSNNTPKYKVSTHFSSAQIKRDSLEGEIKTLACWVKTTASKSTSQFVVADYNSNMCISFYSGCIIGVFGSTRGTGSKSTLGDSYKENDWNHIVVVKTGDAGERAIYCNGVLLTPAANDYWSNAAGFLISGRNTSNTLPMQGYISDVRAYATALSASDVKSLYQNCATIDADGTIHGQIRS